MGLPAQNRIRARRDFLTVQDSGFRISCGPFVFLAAEATDEARRLGLVASRRMGNAVARNRAKRRFRALFAAHLDALPAGTDCVIILRHGINRFPFLDLTERFLKACARYTNARQAGRPVPSQARE